jgi:hypothetical protein
MIHSRHAYNRIGQSQHREQSDLWEETRRVTTNYVVSTEAVKSSAS